MNEFDKAILYLIERSRLEKFTLLVASLVFILAIAYWLLLRNDLSQWSQFKAKRVNLQNQLKQDYLAVNMLKQQLINIPKDESLGLMLAMGEVSELIKLMSSVAKLNQLKLISIKPILSQKFKGLIRENFCFILTGDCVNFFRFIQGILSINRLILIDQMKLLETKDNSMLNIELSFSIFKAKYLAYAMKLDKIEYRTMRDLFKIKQENIHPLMQYALSRLKFLGTLNFKQNLFAVFKTPDNRIYFVGLHSVLGLNRDEIVDIKPDKIKIAENLSKDLNLAKRYIILSLNP